MKVLAGILLLGALCIVVPSNGHADTAIVVGSCNIIMQNVKVFEKAVIINESDCPDPNGSAADRFRVRYLWLDSTVASFMVSGYFDPSLKQVMGTTPSIMKNAVYRRVEDIVSRFGQRVNSQSDAVRRGSLITLKGSKGQEGDLLAEGASAVPIDVLKRLRIYGGSNPIVWPDIAALRSWIKTPKWPDGYDMTYRDLSNYDLKRNRIRAENETLACTVLYTTIRPERLNRYWDDMEQLAAAVEGGELREAEVTHEHFGSGEFKLNALDNPAIEALRYFGEKHWPDDFLLAFGNVYQCNHAQADEYNIGFYALPRKLFILVALIEARTKLLEISGMNFLVDSDEQLRNLRDGTQKESSPAGVISLKRGESVLIPLRIELRYELDDDDLGLSALRNDKDAAKSYRRIVAAPVDVFKLRGTDGKPDGTGFVSPSGAKARIIFEKLKATFRKPEPKTVTQTYIFGPAYAIQEIKLGDKVVPVRSVPENALIWAGKVGQGSCPFLFVDTDAGDPSLIGRVLVGAHSAELARSDEIQLPLGTKAIFVSEQEPEVTYLKRVAVKRVGGDEVTLGKEIEIGPGRFRRFELPIEFANHPPVLIIDGYYRTLPISEQATMTR